MYYYTPSNTLVDHVIPALEVPVPWGDDLFQDDPTYHRVIDYINNLSDDSSIAQSEEAEEIDPTRVPVSRFTCIFLMYYEYSINALQMVDRDRATESSYHHTGRQQSKGSTG